MFQSLSGARLSKIGARQPARAGVIFVAAALVASLLSGIPMQSVRAAVQDAGLQFDGTDDYVSFGQATATLGASTFTLEAWVNRAPGGDLMGTGTHGLGDDGLPQAYPVLTKGCGEGDSSNVDLNYWLGVTDGGAIAADFEDYASGLNHPVVGIGTFPTGEWHHVAATYDGQVWNLYLDGNLDQTLDLGSSIDPRYDSIQWAALGSSLLSTGVPGTGTSSCQGYFSGKIDEARVWSAVRTQTQIHDNMSVELTSGTGLLGRWGLNGGSGLTAVNSVAGSPNGTLVNGTSWFPPDETAPAAPTGLAATSGVGEVALTWDANSETDLAGYNVYRSTGTVTKDTPINGGTLLTSPAYTDTTGTPGTAYNYAVTAVDTSTNESDLSGEATGTPSSPEPGAYGLDLGSDTAYVTFGDPDKLGLAVFTLETWFKRTGTGATTSTGTGGITAIPLVTKGRGEADGNNRDMNYFLGIQGSDGVLAADLEDLESGLNHKVTGTTAIPADSTWHHAAATYDGSTWRLYLDGVLDGSATILCAPANVCVPRSDSIQHAGSVPP